MKHLWDYFWNGEDIGTRLGFAVLAAVTTVAANGWPQTWEQGAGVAVVALLAWSSKNKKQATAIGRKGVK